MRLEGLELLLLLAAALLAAGGARALLAHRRLRVALGLLRLHVRRTADGARFDDAPVPQVRDAAELAHAFNHWLRRVRAMRAELEVTTHNLETMVAERTRELRRSERKYRSLVGQAPIGILLWDPASREVLEVNARAAALLGERPRDLLGRPLDQIFAEAERERGVRALATLGEIGSLRLEEIALAHRDRGSVPAELGASLVRLGSEVLVLGIVQDLTEKKELERRALLSRQQVRRSEKLASIGQLAAGVAHEINNPMGYVASNINRLAEYAKRLSDLVQQSTTNLEGSAQLIEIDELVSEVEEIAQDASEGVQRVTEIVRALREFSHGGSSDEYFQWADLNAIVQNCLTLVHNELKHRADVVTELEPLPPLRCHPLQLGQVVVNLLRNAAQALGPGRGTIRIETHATAASAQIVVEDDGCGIPPEQIPLIFEPFFTTKAVGQGTGLGLAVSRELVHAHGGEIWVDSRVGRGSRFVVELTQTAPSADAAARAVD